MKTKTTMMLLAAVVAGSFALSGATGAAVQENLPATEPVPDGPVTVNGGWHYFNWGGGEPAPINQNPFTFTAAGLAILKVTDAFCYGDQFSVADNGAPVGVTSAPGSDACGGPSDPDAAYADPDMSSGCFAMLPGAHSVTLEAIVNPFGGGGGYLRVDDATDPAELLSCLALPI